MSVDPMWAKYRPLTTYHYGANAPTYTKDPGGDTIIILWDYEGAKGAGHAAILIGSEKEGWKYYSKNGGSGIFGSGGSSEKPDVGVYFSSLQSFKKAGESDENISRYDKAVMIPTTKKEDERAKEAADASTRSDYGLFVGSCVDVVSDALRAAGKKDGTYIEEEGGIQYERLADIPNNRVNMIIRQNPCSDVSNAVIVGKDDNVNKKK